MPACVSPGMPPERWVQRWPGAPRRVPAAGMRRYPQAMPVMGYGGENFRHYFASAHPACFREKHRIPGVLQKRADKAIQCLEMEREMPSLQRYSCQRCGRTIDYKGICDRCPQPATRKTGVKGRAMFACTGCGKTIDHKGYCDKCSQPRAKTRSAGGRYGPEHQRAREVLLANFVQGTRCEWCGEPMFYPEQQLDADHFRATDGIPTRLLHAKCNRARGNMGVPIGPVQPGRPRRRPPGVA